MKFNSFKKGIVALACVPLALAAGSAAAAQWRATETGAFNTDVATKLGKEDDNRIIHVQVSLKLHNKDELDNIVARQNTHGDSLFGTALSHEEVVNRYWPTREEALAVANHLKQYGASNITVSRSNLLVDADIRIADARNAFNTDFARFNLNGRVGFANTRAASLPSHLNALAVLGLDNLHEHHTMYAEAKRDAKINATAQAFNPTQLPKAYGISSAGTGSNTVAGIIAEGNLTQTQSDLSTFESANTITPVTVKVEGPGSSDTSGTIEWNLDTQDIVAMSGGVKQLVLYDASALSDAALTSDYDLVVSDNSAKAINVSLGACEKSEKTSGGMATDDQIFESASVQGQTFFVSSGDSNAKECKFFFFFPAPGDSYPASSPYVVSVGGTSLYVTSSGTYSSETVWDTNSTEGTGGGPSLDEPEPSWQKGVKTITNSKRGVPDIALDADPATGVVITYKGKANEQVGGTSLAAPLATGLWARAQSAHGNSLGFGAQLIYGLPSSDFHDVTSGNNNGYSAAVGWDYCTGFGSPVGDVYVSGL